ncbi:U-box domain-containing protein [Rhynchospora pubera]|uniref:U-box domain-containing protein n=1 Tax=Rhynchospora pubera TaxID=906938 RepID=A0AAV8EBQ6_9POAL|nr:U-box domain-containing protein [Rhynchospora pubera]
MDQSDQVEAKIYVALPERLKEGKYTLSWVLNHFSSDSIKIIITHVHKPSQKIPISNVSMLSFSQHQVNSYRKEEREKAEKHLNDYISQCTKAKFKAEKLTSVSDDVAHRLVELISLHGMCNLVMGAASDRRAAISPQNVIPRRSNFDVPNLHGGTVSRSPPRSPIRPSRMHSDNYSNDFSEGTMRSDAASSIASEDVSSNSDLLSMNKDDDFEVRSLHEPRMDSQVSTQEQGTIADVCAKLQAALADEIKYRAQLNEEICKREKAEMDLVSLIQKVSICIQTSLKLLL